MPVNTECEAHKEGKDLRSLVDALWGDTPEMRLRGTEFLPAHKGDYEDDGKTLNANYKSRLEENTLVNYLKPAIQNLSGKVFQKPIVMGEAMQGEGEIAKWMEDIDLEQSNINDYAINLFEYGVRHGVSYTLVDAPANDNSATLKDQRDNNVRPYVSLVTDEQLIGRDFKKHKNLEVLAGIRISENYTTTKENDRYSEEIRTQIREIVLNTNDEGEIIDGCTWTVWRQTDDESKKEVSTDLSTAGWYAEDSGSYNLNRIPLVPFYTNKMARLKAETFFKTLAYLNLQHWQSSSYQRNILNVVRVPRPYAFGLQEEEVAQLSNHGVRNGIYSTNEADTVDVGFIEAKGDSIKHGKEDLESLEEHMAIRALDPILKKAVSTQIATIATIENDKANSILENWAQSLQSSLIQVVELMLELGRQNEIDVELSVNDDFEIISDIPERVKELREMRAQREISRETFLKMLVRMTFLDEDFDIQAEIARLKAEEGVNDIGEFDEPERIAS